MKVKTKIRAKGDNQAPESYANYRGMPPQKVTNKEKYSEAWQKLNVDSLIGMGSNNSDSSRSSDKNKQTNYDIVNSQYKQSSFQHVLDPHGTGFKGMNAKMQTYNILRQPIESLKGEEMKMGLNMRAVAVNGEAVNAKRTEKTKALEAALQEQVLAKTQNREPEGKTPQEIDKYFKTEYSNPTEIACNKLLKYLTMADLLQMKFSKGWEHALISAEEIYHLSIVGGRPSVRACNPLNVSFDKEIDSPFIHDGDWAMEERWVPVGTVIDLYGDELKDCDVERLDKGEMGGSFSNGGQYPGFAYDFDGGTEMEGSKSQNTSHVYVANVAWRSYKKIGYLSYLDERTGSVETTTVDETFKMTPEMKEMQAVVEWEWITEIWEGTRIGSDIYVGVRPRDNQTGKLPYVGYVYNNINSVATSLVDMAKSHQFTYIIVWYRLEQELAKAKGKKFVMDLAQVPKSQGWTVDQWMHYFDNQGVAWINSAEEGREGDINSVSRFNQFTSIDMSLSNVVSQYMAVLQKLEDQVERITGVSRQRAGDVGASETVGGARMAVINSTNNTKPLFFYHDLVKQGVLQELMELCKVAYADGAEIEFALDEQTIETIKIDAGMLNSTDMGVFITNSFDELQNKEKLEQYLDIALQQDKADLSDIVSVLGTNSMSELRDTLVSGERDKQARDSQASKEANETQERINQANLQDKQADRDAKWEEAKLKSDTDILIAEMKSQTPEETNDELAERKQELDERRQSSDEANKAKDLEIKQSAAAETARSNKVKESIAKSKNVTRT